MHSTTKINANKAVVLEALQNVREELRKRPGNTESERALEQCDRLQVAIEQFHAEAIRFAAFTLLRMVQHNCTAFTPSVQNATVRLRETLETAGLPH